MRSVLPVLAIAALGACANSGDEPMFILGNTAQMTGAIDCMFTGDPDQPITSSGTISVASPTGYIVSPLVQSRITSPMGQELMRTIQLEGATIALSVPNGSTSITLEDNESAFQALFAVDIAPQGTANVSFELIPESVIEKVATLSSPTADVSVEVVAQLTLFGTMGGSKITGQTWQYPVTICNDCVVFDHGACPLTVTTIRPGDPCNVFQDGQVDCCEEAGALICPGPTM